MKNTITLMALVVSLYGYSQGFYNPSVSSKTYTQLTNGIKLSEYPGNPRRYVISVSKPVMLFNELANTSWTIGAEGFMVSQSSTHGFAVDPLLLDLMEGTTNSGVYAEYDSISVPQRFSVEWRNMVPVGHPATDYVNVTAHIYSDQSVEYHYGPSQVTDTTAFNGKTGPDVFLILFQGGFTNIQEYHKMIGSPANPTFGTAPSANTLIGVPADGTVYRYEPFNIGLQEDSEAKITLYPNPVHDQLILEGIDAAEVEILSLNGSFIASRRRSGNSIDVSELSAGIYLLAIKGGDAIIEYHKFIKL